MELNANSIDENSSESEVEDYCDYIYIELDGNVIERIEIPIEKKSK